MQTEEKCRKSLEENKEWEETEQQKEQEAKRS